MFCYDCKKQIEIKNNAIKGGLLLVYDDDADKIKILKCRECFKQNPALENFRKCEVYSRVVGYYRPVGQWNAGKQKEFKKREEFELK